MTFMVKKTLNVLLLVACAAALTACESRSTNESSIGSSNNELEEHPKAPPLPLEALELQLTSVCPINIRDWRRTYSYKWSPKSRKFDHNELVFLLERGPYRDLEPSREWRNVIEVVRLDDRPGIEVIFGYYNLSSKSFRFDVGKCPEKPGE